MPTTVETTLPEPGVVQAQWPSFTTAETNGTAVQLSRWVTKSVQVSGAFGATPAVVQIMGSNDGSVWTLLKDSLGNDLSFNAAGIADIAANTRYIRPFKQTDDASLDVAITIIGV